MACVYSCCFWFSLRLGGILIALLSLLQMLLLLIGACLALENISYFKSLVSDCLNNMQLIYAEQYFESIHDDPEKYLTLAITLSVIHIILCMAYIYGAYQLSTCLMVGFLAAELARLAALAAALVLLLVVLKENSMDIGVLIGGSVAVGFVLLGMLYLWACAASLPAAAAELERDAQAQTIARLAGLLAPRRDPHAHAYAAGHQLFYVT